MTTGRDLSSRPRLWRERPKSWRRRPPAYGCPLVPREDWVALNPSLPAVDAERVALGKIGHRLGLKVLADVATVARPNTILGWYRKLVARKFDGSKPRRDPGRPRIKRQVEQLIIRMASDNRDWGYDRI